MSGARERTASCMARGTIALREALFDIGSGQ
jgi:hypothetical protein